MTNKALGLAAVLLAGFLVVGCGDDAPVNPCPDGEFVCDDVCIPTFDATLTDIQTNVFDVSCTASSCHDDQNPAANLDLSSVAASETNLINAPSGQVSGDLVVPGDVEASYLYDKLTDNNIAPNTTPMPQGGFPLCQGKIDAVEIWIANNAPIN